MLGKLAKMSVREAMITLSGRPPMYGERPRWLKAVAEQIGVSARMARSLWNDEISNPEHWAFKALRREIEARQTQEARRDAQLVAEFFSRRAEALASIDPDFHREQIDAFVEAARALSHRDSA